MKTNCYIYGFTVPNFFGKTVVFENAVDIRNINDTTTASDIFMAIRRSAYEFLGQSKKHDHDITLHDLTFTYVALVHSINQ